ncbi:MAG TPA: ABC transporter ATP-binding protein [Ktedonobacterales bacterium]|nr:ABC transporter ATP-binding protein [Ktedonobacterales bacterium]
MSAAIACRGLTKRYGDVLALDHLTLDVPTGSIFGFLGPNGAGKTTTLRLLTGLAFPTEGGATVAGTDIASSGVELRKRTGYLDQSPQFYGWMRGRELLEFVGELFGLRGAELRGRVDGALTLTGLKDAANRRIHGYSGGMRQRLGLAQALVNRPDVLLLDEPVSALDPEGRHAMLDVIAGLRGQATVLMSSHILADIERVCDTVAILDRGRLVVSSSVAELRERYTQPVFLLEMEPGQEERAEDLIAALRAAPWVDELTWERPRLRLVARDEATAGREILAALVAHGVEIQRFERARPTLEDIFLRLTGGEREKGTVA